MRWEDRQHRKQLDHYRPKRMYNYEVNLELSPPVNTGLKKGQISVFMSGGKSTMQPPMYLSSNWWMPLVQWKPPEDMLRWLNENIGTDYYICKSRGVLAFTKPEDALAFKLMWR